MIDLKDVAEKKLKRPGGVEIAYWLLGEDGPPIVLITGLATPAATWSVLPGILAESGYRVLVVDNRDCGKSSPCEGLSYTVADMAGDVAAAMDDAGFDQAYVFGISMGGMIAQELVLNHPEKVRKLMLVATSHGGPRATVASAEVLTNLFSRGSVEHPVETMAELLGKLMGPGFAERNTDAIHEMAKLRVALGSDPAGFGRQWEAILGHNTHDRLPSVTTPVLILHGEDDPLVPFENAKKIQARIPGAELLPLPGVGHFVPFEAPAETVGAINRFFPVKSAEKVTEPA